jgi:hypothetical protein
MHEPTIDIEGTLTDIIAVTAWLKLPDTAPPQQQAALARLRELAKQLGLPTPIEKERGPQ